MEKNMGKQKVVEMKPQSITPQQIIYNLTPALSVEGRARGSIGVAPIGYYRGDPRFWDLDLAVVQPLVLAEQQHILGNIDGVTEDVDLQTITVPAGAVAGTVITETLRVPVGEVWFITCITGICPADATGTIVYNWRCTLFPDPAGNLLGGVYHTNWVATPLFPQDDEFSAIAVVFLPTNKPVPLRLPAGESISGQLANAAGAANATGVVGTMQLFGWKGKLLVS